MRPQPSRLEDTDEMTGLVEEASARLREALALLVTIDDGGLLGELPASPAARRSHQSAVSMLAILRREMETVADELEAAVQTRDVLERAVRQATASK